MAKEFNENLTDKEIRKIHEEEIRDFLLRYRISEKLIKLVLSEMVTPEERAQSFVDRELP